MAIIGLRAVRDQLSFTDDMAGFDEALLAVKLEAAQGMIERRLGFKLVSRFGGAGQEAMPDALKEAVAMLAAHLYADREGREPFPVLVLEVVNDFRDWTF